MDQLLQFRVTDTTSPVSIIIRCKISLTDSLIKQVIFYASKTSIKSFRLRATTNLLRSLAISGTYKSTIRGRDNYAEKIQELLQHEFGNRYKIKIGDIPLDPRRPGFRPDFSQPITPSRAAKKGKVTSLKKDTLKKSTVKYKLKTSTDEVWSNFDGGPDALPIRSRTEKKVIVKRSAVKKAAMKKVTGGGIANKLVLKPVAKKAALKKAGAGTVKKLMPKSVAKKAVAKKPTVKPIAKKPIVKKAVTKKIESEKVGDKSNYSTIKVFYTTDREKSNSPLDPPHFLGNPNGSNKLKYGYCNVSIPNSHTLGDLERPSWFRKGLFLNQENPSKHISTLAIFKKTKDDFFADLMDKIGSSSDKDAFIFIHGFNVSFEQSIWRTAQIAYDLSFDGAPITYSWPSKGKSSKKDYMTDEQTVEWTVPHLKEFLITILTDPKIEKLHLLAHSMGTRVLTKTIMELKISNPDLTPKINQIILAAPDIDAKLFVDTIAPAINKAAQQITLYASSKDKALKISKWFRDAHIRAGQAGSNIVIVNGVDTIDVSKVDCSFSGHSYFAETSELINDIFHLLKHSFTPTQRNLKPVTIKNKGNYWLFP